MPAWASPIPLLSFHCKLSLCLKIARKNCGMLMGDALCCSSCACTDSGQGLGATEGCKNHHHPGKPSAAVQVYCVVQAWEFPAKMLISVAVKLTFCGEERTVWGGGGGGGGIGVPKKNEALVLAPH